MKRTMRVTSLMSCWAMVCCLVAAPCAADSVWFAYPDEDGIVVARSLLSGRLSEPVAVVEGGETELPVALALDGNGLPAVAWLNGEGEILFSAYDGLRWSAPDAVATSHGRHRGEPSLALGEDGLAMVAWAEADAGAFEDVFYSVRTGGRWTEPCRAHEANDVPDIVPRAVAAAGRFLITWRTLEGDSYVERQLGDDAVEQGRGEVPGEVREAAREGAMPALAAAAWRNDDGSTHAAHIKDILDDGKRLIELEERSGSFQETARSAGSTTIVAFGDSITYGRGSSSDGPRTGYPVYLQAILDYDYPGHRFQVINQGNSGERTDGGLNRIDEVLTRHDPDGILIMEGTNDIYYGISFETIQENLKQMALKAAKRGVVPILATIIPTHPQVRYAQYARTRSFYLGRYVQTLQDRYGVPYSDQWNAFVSMPDFGTLINPNPGNHPNDNGYLYAMAPRWFETLASLITLPFDPRPVELNLFVSNGSIARGSDEVFSYSLFPSNDIISNAVDCYLAVRAPDNRIHYFNSSGGTTTRVTPIVERVFLQNLPSSGRIFDIQIPGTAPPGTYTLYSVTVRSLHDPWDGESWTSNLASVSFTVTE